MLKKIEKDMEKYMYSAKVLGSNSECKDECYVFGYLDGYFDEEVYLYYVMNNAKSLEIINYYKSGFDKGAFDRKRTSIYEPKVLKKDKLDWIKKLALHDVLNSIEFRNLKDDSLSLYNTYKEGTFSLKKMDFIKDSDVFKKNK